MIHSKNQTVTGNTIHTRPENRAFYPALDGLRGVAFLMVFLQHYLFMGWGWTGVNLFFVLSGFLITGILYDTRDDVYRVRNFYIRRTLRIFPLFYGIILILLVLYPVMHWEMSWSWISWPLYFGNLTPLFYAHMPILALQRVVDFQLHGAHGDVTTTLYLGHFWSLCVEEQFYLIWPWLVFALRKRTTLLSVCLAMLPLCLLLRVLGQNHLPAWVLDHNFLQKGTPFCVDAIFVGSAIALFLRGPHAANLLRLARVALPVCLVALVVIGIFTHSANIFADTYHYPASVFTWDLSLVDLLAAMVLLCAIQPGSLVYRMFHIKPLRWLGRISYGAYILHDIPHDTYVSLGQLISPAHADLFGGLIGLVCTIVLARLSFRFFESPFLNLKERWTIRN